MVSGSEHASGTWPFFPPLSGWLAMFAATLLATGCADERPPDGATPAIVVTDEAGRSVALAAPAVRVISLVPARTEAILALGAGDRLIARTEYDADPSLRGLPSVGNALNPSVEWLAAQRPDLVIAWADGESRTVIDRLQALGVAAYATRVETLAELDTSIARLGTLLGLDARADSLRAALAADFSAVRDAVAGRPPKRSLLLVGTNPPTAAGPGTFLHELLELAGGDNVFGELTQRWPQVAIESIVRRAPDAIIVTTTAFTTDPAARFSGLPGWNTLSAVRTGQVFEVDADLFNRLGPRSASAARQLAGILHPDAFPATSGAALVPRP